jgi:hypothetical protein
MAEFDLDNQPSDPKQPQANGRPPVNGGPPMRGQLPTARASDLLKSRASLNNATHGDGPLRPDFDRRATPVDDFASGVLALAGIVYIAALGYLLYEMWSGNFAGPNWNTIYTHELRHEAVANIQLCAQVMWIAILFGTVLFLFLFYHEDYAGYSLLAGALLLQLGVPYATGLLYGQTHHAPTDATKEIFQLLIAQSWVIGIPGFILTLINIFKAIVEGLEDSRAKRANLKFGQKAIRDRKPRNVFLGDCWNLPYCKDGIRARCPIFVKKSGPCWRNKRGCMCDQTIVLLAQAPNWKQNVAAAVGGIEGNSGTGPMPKLPPQPQLTKEQKNERCRQCVIFNVHQEQKYKLLVGIILTGTVVGLALYSDLLLGLTGDLFMQANNLVSRFSISTHTTPLFPSGAPQLVEWLILSSVLLVLVAKVLQVAEWVCFRIKI